MKRFFIYIYLSSECNKESFRYILFHTLKKKKTCQTIIGENFIKYFFSLFYLYFWYIFYKEATKKGAC